jgi:4-hydroxy-tetrahydrodipicolinate reductase
MNFMRIAILGYGKMGKEIERAAIERGWEIGLKIDIDTPPATQTQRENIDVVIHFASSDKIFEDLSPWAEAKKPIVVGTTGWQNQMPKVKSLIEKNQTALVYASNFSIGVNIFYQLVRTASQIMDRFTDYDAFIQEIHHRNKVDSPSGTALSIGQIVLHNLHRKTELLSEPPRGKILPEQLHVSSVRSGTVVGTHVLEFDSAADSIELKHTAKNRSGLALGTLLATEWIQGKKGIFTMDDVFQDLFKQGDR